MDLGRLQIKGYLKVAVTTIKKQIERPCRKMIAYITEYTPLQFNVHP